MKRVKNLIIGAVENKLDIKIDLKYIGKTEYFVVDGKPTSISINQTIIDDLEKLSTSFGEFDILGKIVNDVADVYSDTLQNFISKPRKENEIQIKRKLEYCQN